MDFRERLQETINQGLKTSQDLFGKAKDKAMDLGEIGVLRLEIRQLEAQAEKLLARLGSAVYGALAEQDKNMVSKSTPDVAEIIIEIGEVRRRIEKREQQLKKVEKST